MAYKNFHFNPKNVESHHGRTSDAWRRIFADQVEAGHFHQMAERIMGDMLGYGRGYGEKRRNRYFDTDVDSLANALRVIAELGANDFTSEADVESELAVDALTTVRPMTNPRAYEAKHVLTLPKSVALWADENETPHYPWEKPANAHPITVKAGEIGYWKVNPTLNVDHYNSHADNGKPASRQQIAAMLNGSLFGFHCPAADPATYDENGEMRKR